MASGILNQITVLETMFGDNEHFSQLEDSTIQTGLERARRLIIDLTKGSPEIRTRIGLERWNQLVQTIQNLAFTEPDEGGEADIASWCQRQWAETLQLHPQSITAMKGLGQSWLLKSQLSLSRIYLREQSPSPTDGGGKQRLGISRPRPDPSEAEDTARIQSHDYVEARTSLRPALEYLERAVAEAENQDNVSGRLLELCAEAYMSFGNVSHPRNNEMAYQKALRMLRQANEVKGHTMDQYLEEFLDENVNYIR